MQGFSSFCVTWNVDLHHLDAVSFHKDCEIKGILIVGDYVVNMFASWYHNCIDFTDKTAKRCRIQKG